MESWKVEIAIKVPVSEGCSGSCVEDLVTSILTGPHADGSGHFKRLDIVEAS